MAIAQLRPEGDVLVGHVVPDSSGVPRSVLVARILSEVGRSASGRRSVDRRQQSEVASRIAHLSAAQSERVLILRPPHAVVEHIANEVLLVCGASTSRSGCCFIAVAGYVRARIDGIGSDPHLATSIGGEGKCGLVNVVGLVVVVLHLDTIVRVISVAVWNSGSVFTHTVVIEDQVKPWLGAIENLSAESRLAVISAIGLPPIDAPRLYLQLLGGKELSAQASEEPRSIGGDIR